jgi:hypothetical protein
MNALYAVRKSDEANQLLKNRQDKNRCDAMDDITAAVARGCSAYSLAGAYSDPINNEPAGKENEGEGYDQVTYQQQHTADKVNIYDHMSNLI